MLPDPELRVDTEESGPYNNCGPIYFHCRERHVAYGVVRIVLRWRHVFKSRFLLRRQCFHAICAVLQASNRLSETSGWQLLHVVL